MSWRKRIRLVSVNFCYFLSLCKSSYVFRLAWSVSARLLNTVVIVSFSQNYGFYRHLITHICPSNVVLDRALPIREVKIRVHYMNKYIHN